VSNVVLKHPSDDIDFTFEWNNLGTAVLAAVVHTPAAGSSLNKVNETFSNGTTPPSSTVRLSGGTVGIYPITASATLSNGRTLVRTMTLRVLPH
jgi:hypothetical protein